MGGESSMHVKICEINGRLYMYEGEDDSEDGCVIVECTELKECEEKGRRKLERMK